MKPAIIAPIVALALAGGGAGAYFWLTSDGSVEEAAVVQPTATPTPAATETPTPTPSPTQPPGGSGGGGLEGTVVPIATPFPSPPPVPADWATFTQPVSEKSDAFTFRHPAGWLVQGGDPTGPGVGLSIVMWSWVEGKPPPNSLKIDLYVDPLAHSSCELEDASTAELGGIVGSQTQRTYDPVMTGGLVQTHRIAVNKGLFQYCLTAYFTEGVDQTTFLQLVDSFTFTD